LNRLRASVWDLGVNKVILAARQMFELDPYLDIQILPAGITDANLGDLFGEGTDLDLVIEECDDLRAKVLIREEARRRRIPVVMETSDRGMIDVERYDREPGRLPFHGLAGPLRSEDLKDLGIREKLCLIMKILEADRLSSRAQTSLAEINRTLQTWPQLASAVALGGGLTTDVFRRILLGQFTFSGRYRVDLENLIANGV
jgi:hypothetical protein